MSFLPLHTPNTRAHTHTHICGVREMSADVPKDLDPFFFVVIFLLLFVFSFFSGETRRKARFRVIWETRTPRPMRLPQNPFAVAAVLLGC